MTLNPAEKTNPSESLQKLLVAATPLPSFDLSKRPPSASGAGPALHLPPSDSVVLSNPNAAPEEALENLAVLVSGEQTLPQLADIPTERLAAELRGLLSHGGRGSASQVRQDGQPPLNAPAVPSPAPEALLKEMAALVSDPKTLSQLAQTSPEKLADGLRAALTRQDDPPSAPDKPSARVFSPRGHAPAPAQAAERPSGGPLAETGFLLLVAPPAYGHLAIRREDRQESKAGAPESAQTAFCVALDLFAAHIGVVRVRLALSGGELVGTLAFPDKEWAAEADKLLGGLESALSKAGIQQSALRVMTATAEGE